MGSDNSALASHGLPVRSLQSRDVEGVAKYIKSGKVKKIVMMTGAGISTSSGIPDFRSPETGLYANLARLNLPYAEAVFDISYFRQNPLPFYTLAHELYPGRYRPTITHSFIRLLSNKGLLLKHFTQNVDCLDRQAGVPDDMIVEAHGSFARQRCIECRVQFPDDLMEEAVKSKEVPHCLEGKCGGLVKPDIVFFGEALPPSFFQNRSLPGDADLCLVMGTSLSVHPFASLPELVSDHAPRILLNQEQVGSLGSRPDDVLLLGACDDGVRKLAEACGWLEELEMLWAATAFTSVDSADRPMNKSKDELLEDEVNKLTQEIEQSLKLSHEHEKATAAAIANEETQDKERSSSMSKDDIECGSTHIKKPSL